MISVMNEYEIDRNPSHAPDLSFFGMESHQNAGSPPDPTEDTPIPPSLDPPASYSSPDLEESMVGVSPPRSSTNYQQQQLIEAVTAATSGKALVPGDMVWGKVKSHPWWPGLIFNEAFASSSVRRTKRDGLVLVAFFGDSSYGWFELDELIPYEPNFVEKSRQTTLRSFVHAVEESVDESSRRAALGISCRCRNASNFRATKVPNYYAVDVVGYERNGIYSKRQIKKERDSFNSNDLLSFLKQLALNPKGDEVKDVPWHRNVALGLALRRAFFEEFDETYAQAFGQQPVRPARNEMGVPEQAESYAPRGAPLSGPLVFAEPVGHRKKPSASKHSASSSSSSSAHHKEKDKSSSSKKNKYVLKRRDENSAVSSSVPVLPDGLFPSKPLVLEGVAAADSSASAASDFVFQKRDDGEPLTPVTGSESMGFNDQQQLSPEDVPQTPPIPVYDDDATVEQAFQAVVPVPVVQPTDGGNEMKVKKKKVKKRALDDIIINDHPEVANVEKKKKKKKMKHGDVHGQDFRPGSKKTVPRASPNEASESSIVLARPVSPPGSSALAYPVSPPIVDPAALDQLELPDVVADLRTTALDHFYGVGSNTPSVVRHVILRYRSLVYSKSVVVPSPNEPNAQWPEPPVGKPTVAGAGAAPRLTKKEARVQKKHQREQGSSPVKPGKLLRRSDDPTRAGKKRAPSDRQEELSAKRMKKVDKLKSLASEKKAAATANAQKTLDGPKGSSSSSNGAAATTSATALATSSAEQARRLQKQEALLPLPPRRENPTYLTMKFPKDTQLPSVNNLKARFARFGPLVIDSTRVFWRSHSCRVLFKYKPDALKALKSVKENDVFGQYQVDCTIRELELPAPEPVPEPVIRRDPARMGNGSDHSGGLQLQQAPVKPPKSILKRPGEEAGKDNRRVNFDLSDNGGGSRQEPQPPSASSSVSFSDVGQPQPLKSVSFQVPLAPFNPPAHRPSVPQPVLPLPSRSYEHHHPLQNQLPQLRAMENRAPPPSVQFSEAQREWQQAQQQQPASSSSSSSMEGRNGGNVDIRHQMLSLLLRCSDIVASLQSRPEYVRYRPL